ncbi:pre-mRNA-splicing factor 18 [Acrasis kona]|uniref:Pre-mRNA-splicing factor 18 n=1 Tax=Acrasis kona TaxID=1008807 RepID=A0AAW2ZE81_9EUKA
MNFLKSAIDSTKRDKNIVTGNVIDVRNKWYRKGDEQAERDRLYKEQTEKEHEQQLLKRKRDEMEQKDSANKSESSYKPKKLKTSQEEEEHDVEIPKNEVIKTLRSYGQPATLFGETDETRQKRLRLLQTNEGELSSGSQNIFAKALKEREQELLKQTYENKPEQTSKLQNKQEVDTELPKPPKNVSDEEYVRHILKRLLSEWGVQVENQSEEEKKSFQGKHAATLCKQTKDFLHPLMKKLKKKTLAKDILTPLKNICVSVAEREYVKANDLYLQLSIGNAPWPMGVTMVGIHARSARERINTDQIAHVLNDEEQRKYIQSVKRLMTFAQTKYSTDPSKMVSV